MTSTSTTIAVLGGNGRTGNFVVKELLNQGYFIKLLVRDPESVLIQHRQIEVIKGDARDPERIKDLVKDCQGIISTVGQRQGEPLVASVATRLILDAMKEFNVTRYIVVAGLNLDVPTDRKSPQTLLATEWMKTNFPIIQQDRQQAYTLLTLSSVQWTLVRVPFIEFTNAMGKLTISVEDCLGTKINAGDIAEFVVQQLSNDQFHRQAPFISSPQ